MSRITLTELADIYGVSERSLGNWRRAKLDVFSPCEVYAYLASLSRLPPNLREKSEAIRRLEELTDRKIAESPQDDGGGYDDGTSIAAQLAREKLRKLTADASRAEFLLAQSRRELVSLADDVAPAQTQAITEFCEEVEAMFPELGDLCDRLPGNEIMSKGLNLFYSLRERFHARLQRVIEELEAA